MLGVGYATPYLGLFREEAERCLAFMPAAQGVVKWPTARPALSALVDELELPLPDAAVDRVLLVHALEMSQDATALLREIWRVLAPAGQLLAVVPNRRGLWARMDTTPFGHGRPYSRSQITHLLRDAWFTPVAWSEALYVPPIQRGWFLRSAVAWERTGATISAPFAGVHIVEATKQVYRAPFRRGARKRQLVPALQPALAPSPRTLARTVDPKCVKSAVIADGALQDRQNALLSCCRFADRPVCRRRRILSGRVPSPPAAGRRARDAAAAGDAGSDRRPGCRVRSGGTPADSVAAVGRR